jgi:chromosome segregation ATPase
VRLFHRIPRAPDELEQLRKERARLEARLAELEGELEFCRKQNERIVHDAAPALKENAVLRYQLFKCQSDRQVLEFHVQGSRAEAMAALNLLRRLSPSAEASADLLEATLFFTQEAEVLGVFPPPLQALEARAQALWQERHSRPWAFDPWRWLSLCASSLLQALERERHRAVQAAEHPADGLAAFDAGLGELADRLAGLVQSIAGEG